MPYCRVYEEPCRISARECQFYAFAWLLCRTSIIGMRRRFESESSYPMHAVGGRDIAARCDARTFPAGELSSMPPALPEELIELIVIASLPPEIYSDEYSARYEILRRYSLVSRLWRTMAQREMFRYIYIPTVESANLLDTSPLRDKKREELLQPRAVRFGRYIDQDEDAGYYTSARWLDHVLLRFSNVGHVIVSHFGLETPFDFYAFTGKSNLPQIAYYD